MPVVRWFDRSFAIVRRHLLLTAIVTVVALWWGVPTARKAYYDGKVRSMCAQDGGIKVHEQVRLPAERFDKWGGVRIPLATNAKASDEFVMSLDTKYYKSPTTISGLAMWRDHYRIMRRGDSKILGELILYARRGGDPIGPWESSWYACPESQSDQTLIRSVLVP